MNTQTMRKEKIYDDATINKIVAIVDKSNMGKTFDNGYYILDTTGKFEVYFTLWRYTCCLNQVGWVNPYTYIKNVTTDFAKLEKIINVLSHNPLPILIATCENNDPKVCSFRERLKEGIPIVKFGKYEGKTIDEIYEIDKNYVLWFANNYKRGTYKDFRGNIKQSVPNEEDRVLINSAKVYLEAFFTELTTKNREECQSNYIGELKKRMTIEAKVTYIKEKVESDYDGGEIITRTINMVTNDVDFLYIYDKDFGLKVGDVITLKGTPTKYIERVGKKTTYFNRVEIINKP